MKRTYMCIYNIKKSQIELDLGENEQVTADKLADTSLTLKPNRYLWPNRVITDCRFQLPSNINGK